MTVNKRKKNTRLRGSKTHGWGAMKKHRGQGHRGGRGMAGTGKRADSKKPSIWKNPNYFGRHGFYRHGPKEEISAINVSEVDEQADKLVNANISMKNADVYEIDLEKLGFNKLLGSGKVTKKLKIKVNYASEKAVQSIKEAGGEVIVK